MKHHIAHPSGRSFPIQLAALAAAGLLSFQPAITRASIAYGSINNFDTVNDTGSVCHGFEIELDDIHSTDITYTYDYNHYGAPKITEDNTIPAHPKVIVSYQSAKNADGTWAAFTAIPSAPIAPTMGHQFTNPSVNFGGEHFGVGYRANPTNIVYNWLIDNGAGALVHGGTVSISTPVFVPVAPAAGAAVAIQAVIVPPPPPAPPPIVYEFGHPTWVKEIRTTSHNNNVVPLRDLVSDDPNDPPVKSWKNGEPDEVEMEWQILQTDSGNPAGANNQLDGAAENLNQGDDVVTRRYEFYEYTGPLDPETHEILDETVAADGIHGTGTNANVVVVGKYLGAQMAAAAAAAPVGLIDHVPDGEINTKYTDRTVVIIGKNPFVATTSGVLPNGMSFDLVLGVLSGTPTEAGAFTFTVNATAGTDPAVTKNYTFNIAAAGAPLPPHNVIDTAVSPANAGTTTGDGSYNTGSNITVTATPSAGSTFVSWMDNGAVVSNSASYTFTTDVNRTLTATFAAGLPVNVTAVGGTVTKSPDQAGYATGTAVTLTATPDAGNTFTGWSGDASGATNPLQVTVDVAKNITANFAAGLPVNVTAVGGTVTKSPDQAGYVTGSTVTLTATPDAGKVFTGWSGGASGATNPLQVTVDVAKNITANFAAAYALNITATGGTVALSPNQASYVAGTVVTLTATPNVGNIFTGWSGDATGTTNPLQVTVNTNNNITAAFTAYVPVTVTPSAGAGGTISPNTVQTLQSGNGITFTAVATNGGYGVDKWTVNGTTTQSGGTSLTLTNVTANATVNVTFKKMLPVIHSFNPGPWTPGAAVTDIIVADFNPTKFTVTGLPAGVTVNTSTGQLGGRPTAAVTKPTNYNLTISVTNATGTTGPVKASVQVQPLAPPLVGTFNGLVDRDPGLGGGFGGTISVATTSTATYTGKLTLGGAGYPFTGGLLTAPLGGNGSSTLVIKRNGLPSLTLSFELDSSSGELGGSVTDGVVASPVNIAGWRQTAQAAKVATTYTTALQLDPNLVGTGTTTNVTYPQGEGFGTLTITATGAATWAGQMADGSVTTASTTVGVNGDVPLHFMLYSNAGAAHGWVTATADSTTAPTNGGHALLDGTIDWNKNAQTTATRLYKSGFPLHQLTAVGGEYTKPAVGQFVLGLLTNGGANNARFVFSEGGLSGPSPIVAASGAAGLNLSFRIGATTTATTAVVTLPTGTANPDALTVSSLNTKTGAFTGAFTLKDALDPNKPTIKVSRSVSFYGVLVPRLSPQQGVGYFLLGELPSAGPPATTLSTSPQLSGLVQIQAGP